MPGSTSRSWRRKAGEYFEAFRAANADPEILQLTALVQTVRRWWFEADDVAGLQLADLPLQVRRELAAFMDAVVIVDPMEYQ